MSEFDAAGPTEEPLPLISIGEPSPPVIFKGSAISS